MSEELGYVNEDVIWSSVASGAYELKTLISLLEGSREALEEASRLGLVVRRDGDVVEVSDVDGTSILGFVPSRIGVLVYHVDSRDSSFETLLLEDTSLLAKVPLDAIVEDGRPKPPSTWVSIADPELSSTRGRICYAKGNRVKCKPI